MIQLFGCLLGVAVILWITVCILLIIDDKGDK